LKYEIVIQGTRLIKDNGEDRYAIIFDEIQESDDKNVFDTILENIVRNGYYKFYQVGIPHYYMKEFITCVYFIPIP
jgi:predicted AAA+ superfamily ATPase